MRSTPSSLVIIYALSLASCEQQSSTSAPVRDITDPSHSHASVDARVDGATETSSGETDQEDIPESDLSSTRDGDASTSDISDELDVVLEIQEEVEDGTAEETDENCGQSDLHRYACCVFDFANEFRSENSLPPYLFSAELAEVAFYYADYMATEGNFSHSADGKSFGERLDDFGVPWASAGENLQQNSLTSWQAACNETVRGAGGWRNSESGHREAMLGKDASGNEKNWTHAGAGVQQRDGKWYVAMYFVRF